MKRTIKFIFFAMMAAFAAVSCSEKKTEKPKYLWMCIDANFERFSHKDSICYYLDKAKETGFNQIVVDVLVDKSLTILGSSNIVGFLLIARSLG